MPFHHLFLDTNIILDYIIPSRRIEHICSSELIEKIQSGGDFKAWSADYALAEALGELKSNREKKIGVKNVAQETLSSHEILQLVQVIDEFRKTPNFEVFKSNPVPQEEIFDNVKRICVQSTDAFVLLSALDLKKKLGNLILVTRDERLLVRGKRLIYTAHPVELVGSCSSKCVSKPACKHRC